MVVNWGVIGCGNVATNRTIPEGITQASNARLLAVADVVPDRAAAVGEKYGARSYTSAEDLLRDPALDAVYISVPPFAHAPVAIAAARFGKATLLEKPIALNAGQGETILAAHRNAGTTLGIGFMMRYHACHAQLKAMLDAGEIGTVVAIRARYSVWYPPDPDRPDESWLFDPARAGGGPLMDAGCHALDLMVHLLGSVDRLVAFADTLVQGCQVEDTCSILLQFATGAQGVLQVYNCTPNFQGRNVLEVHGTGGSLIAQNTFTQLPTGTLLHFRKNGQDGRQESEERRVEVEPVNTYKKEIEQFSDSLERREPYWIGGEQGLYVQRLVDAAYRSARERSVLDVSAGYPPACSSPSAARAVGHGA
jgi:predicted dehydrogenase